MPDFDGVVWLAKTETVQVRINTLGPRRATPWHFHSAVTDHVFCLEEGLEVRLREPEATVGMRPGERQEIAPGRVHQVVNTTAHPVRYLLIQANGAYDFNEVS